MNDQTPAMSAMFGDSIAEPTVLSGLVVLELGSRVGVSVAGSMLAQLGAEVVFVEHASIKFEEPKWYYREQFVAGKLPVTVDPADAVHRSALLEWVQACDVLLISSDVDAPAFGDAFALLMRNLPSNAVVCDLTAFGSTGPMRGLAATDPQVQALSGVMESTGTSDGPPMEIPLPLIEHLSGIYAAAAVLASLRSAAGSAYRRSEIAMYDVAFSAMTSFLAPALSGVSGQEDTRVGNRHTMSAPWNVYRANDGWILLCAGNDDQWQRICTLIGQETQGLSERLIKNSGRVAHAGEVDELVQGWVGLRSIDDCIEQFLAISIPCGPVAPIDGFPREDNLRHRGMVTERTAAAGAAVLFLPGSPFRMSLTPGKGLTRELSARGDEVQAALRRHSETSPWAGMSAAVGTPMDLPLRGVRVVEIGHYTTAPVASRLMAALGAEVIKIEPPQGEAVRQWPPAVDGQGVFFTFQNADKKSLILDLESEAGREALRRLLSSADVLVENLRPGALAKKGFSPAVLQSINPRLVYCAISGFGAYSIYGGRPAFDAVIQAMSGLMDLVHVDGMPLKSGPSLADVMGAAFGMTAMLAALVYRDRSGTGQSIDLSMQDIGAWATQTTWNRPPAVTRGSVQRCRDGDVYLQGSKSQDFGAAMRSRSEMISECASSGLTAVPVLGIMEVVRAAQTQERRLWMRHDDKADGAPLLFSPIRFPAAPAADPRPGPQLGRDTDRILKGLA